MLLPLTAEPETTSATPGEVWGGRKGRESPEALAEVGPGSAGPQGRVIALQKGHLQPNTWQQQAQGFTLIFGDPWKVQS